MPVSRLDNARVRRAVREDAEQSVMQIIASTAAQTLTQNSPNVISIDPGVSAPNVVMYTPVPANMCYQHTIINRAAATGTLVVKQADGSTTVFTVGVGKIGQVAWDGIIWRGSSLP
jgi:hypothetical protein